MFNRKDIFMKKFVVILLVIQSLLIASNAQTAPKYPKGWFNFVAQDESFAVLLPELSKTQENEVTKTNNMIIQMLGGKSNYSKISYLGDLVVGVGYQEFSAPLLDDLEREAQFEFLTEVFGEKTGDLFIVLSPVENLNPRGDTRTIPKKIEKFKGIQTVKELGNYYFFSRIFIVQQRLFRLLAMIEKDKVESHRNDILQFFTSFQISEKIPPAKYPSTPLPPTDFKIVADGQKFTSQTLKLHFQFPSNWKTEFHNPNESISPADIRRYEKEKAILRWTWRNRQGFAVGKSEKSKSNITLLINRQPTVNTTLQEFVADRAKLYGIKYVEKEINGIKHLVIEKNDKFKIYFTQWNDYFLEIFCEFETNEDLKLIEESLKTLSK
jgi:hypothetical protein